MKLVIMSLFLTLPVSALSNNIQTMTSTKQESNYLLSSSAGLNNLKNVRSDLLWYVERKGHGWTPFYNIDFTRKFFVKAIKFLEDLYKIMNNSYLIKEESYNKHSSNTLEKDKATISSEEFEVSMMSFGYFSGILVTGPMCLDLANRFWDTWNPIFNTVEQVIV